MVRSKTSRKKPKRQSSARRSRRGSALGVSLVVSFFVSTVAPFASPSAPADGLTPSASRVPGWNTSATRPLLAVTRPAVILTAIQWLLLLAATLLFTRLPGGPELPWLTRVAVASGAAIMAPFLNLISLVIPNAAVLLFPAWFQAGKDAPQGIEATGQRLIFALGQFLVFVLALVPAT